MSDILIGTSGYDYPEWKGVFYPPEVKRADFLSYYATQFNAVELNNTFYNMPTAERLFSFYERSEGRLQFSIKANRLLTHEIDSQWQNAADDFKTALNPLLEKDNLCAVLFQFPQSFHYTNENRIYLAKMIAAFEGFSVVIEFRHKEWIRESVFEGLVQRKASIAFCDMPQLKSLPNADFQNSLYSQFIGPNAYIRLHGRNANAWYAPAPKAQMTKISSYANERSEYAPAPKAQTSIASTHANGAKATYAAGTEQNGSGRYNYEYSEGELKEFVPVVHVASEEGRKVQVYFNNHPKGNGAKNAKMLKEMVQVPS